MNQQVTSHQPLISYEERCRYYRQVGKVIWFTGLSGAGKTTLATAVEKKLIEKGKIVCVLDGDSLRKGLNADLDFSNDARKENIRRIAEIATYLGKQSIIVLVSAISPHRSLRHFARNQAKQAGIDFVEVYVKAAIETCKTRDPKGLYKAAMEGSIESFTGVDSVYEEPENAEVVIDTDRMSLESSVDLVVKFILA